LITLLVVLTLNPIYFLWKYPEIGMMKYYFYLVGLFSLPFLFLVWRAQTKRHYVLLHSLIKLVIILGVMSIVLLDTSVIIERILKVR
jgi:4-hydroxybenzoate polyprenyltransferase